MLIALVFLSVLSARLCDSGVIWKDFDDDDMIPYPDASVFKGEAITIDPDNIDMDQLSDILPGTVVSYADGTPIPGLAESLNSNLSDPLIVNGKPAEKGRQPYIVSIQMIQDNKAVHLCGGSLVSPNKVLTAAHCMAYFGKLPYVAGLGYYQLSLGTKNPGSQLIPILQAAVPTTFEDSSSKGWPHDVAVLTLKRNANLDSHVQLVELSTLLPKDLYGKTVLLNGWGKSDTFGKAMDILQTAELKVITRTECVKRWGTMIHPEHFCVQGPDACACRGDSGSPAMYDGKQVGIVSWGERMCRVDDPRVFQNAYVYSIFIKDSL